MAKIPIRSEITRTEGPQNDMRGRPRRSSLGAVAEVSTELLPHEGAAAVEHDLRHSRGRCRTALAAAAAPLVPHRRRRRVSLGLLHAKQHRHVVQASRSGPVDAVEGVSRDLRIYSVSVVENETLLAKELKIVSWRNSAIASHENTEVTSLDGQERRNDKSQVDEPRRVPGESGAGQVGNLAAEADEDDAGRRRHDALDDSLVHDDADGLGCVVGEAARSVREHDEAEQTQRDGLE